MKPSRTHGTLSRKDTKPKGFALSFCALLPPQPQQTLGLVELTFLNPTADMAKGVRSTLTAETSNAPFSTRCLISTGSNVSTIPTAIRPATKCPGRSLPLSSPIFVASTGLAATAASNSCWYCRILRQTLRRARSTFTDDRCRTRLERVLARHAGHCFCRRRHNQPERNVGSFSHAPTALYKAKAEGRNRIASA